MTTPQHTSSHPTQKTLVTTKVLLPDHHHFPSYGCEKVPIFTTAERTQIPVHQRSSLLREEATMLFYHLSHLAERYRHATEATPEQLLLWAQLISNFPRSTLLLRAFPTQQNRYLPIVGYCEPNSSYEESTAERMLDLSARARSCLFDEKLSAQFHVIMCWHLTYSATYPCAHLYANEHGQKALNLYLDLGGPGALSPRAHYFARFLFCPLAQLIHEGRFDPSRFQRLADYIRMYKGSNG